MELSSWLNLLTLIALEIVLDIDNAIFITFLSYNLPAEKRNRARAIGILLAMVIRLVLLLSVSYITKLTQPLLTIKNFVFSGRDIIFLTGGIFLLFKAIKELFRRLENNNRDVMLNQKCIDTWAVVLQIVILDTVFSLDAVVTIVGIINNLPIIITAVVISMIIMLLISHQIIYFFNRYQPVALLYLSILLVISLSLIAEGFGFIFTKNNCILLVEFYQFLAKIFRH